MKHVVHCNYPGGKVLTYYAIDARDARAFVTRLHKSSPGFTFVFEVLR